MSRNRISEIFIEGCGLEIGALHLSLKVKKGCTVKYVYYKMCDENRVRHLELAKLKIVNTDLIDDGFTLKKVTDFSLDFIIANHTLEYSPDPYGTLLTWKNKLNKGGIVFATVPIASMCYDNGRAITTIEHLKEDHTFFKSNNKQQFLRQLISCFRVY